MVEFLTRSGQRRLVRAFGAENISQDVPYICFKGVKHFFNLAIQEDWENMTDRLTGAIELLIGAEVVDYLSPRGRGRGQLDGLDEWQGVYGGQSHRCRTAKDMHRLQGMSKVHLPGAAAHREGDLLVQDDREWCQVQLLERFL